MPTNTDVPYPTLPHNRSVMAMALAVADAFEHFHEARVNRDHLHRAAGCAAGGGGGYVDEQTYFAPVQQDPELDTVNPKLKNGDYLPSLAVQLRAADVER